MNTPLNTPEPIDPFEEELRTLSPRPVSPSLLQNFHARRTRTHFLRLAITGLAAAACLALFFIISRPLRAPPSPPTIAVHTNPIPTLANYRRALAQSPEALDALFRQTPSDAPLQPDPRPDTLMQSLAKY